MIINKKVRENLFRLIQAVPKNSRMVDFALNAAEGMPRAFSRIGYELDCNIKYKKIRTFALLDSGKDPVYWYKIGMRLGDYMGSYNLGQCFEMGEGVKKDARTAFYYWQQAAASEYEKAKTCLAAAYYNGCGVKKNVPEAFRLYFEAAIQGDKVAKKMLNKLNWDLALKQ